MWRELVDWAARRMTADEFRFADPEDLRIPRCVDTVDEAAEIIEADLAKRREG